MASIKLCEKDAGYIAGLFDGEGCINYSFGTKKYFLIKENREETYHAPQAALIITNKNNLLLEIIKTQIGYGKIYRAKGGRAYDYRINNLNEILCVIEVLSAYVKLKNDALCIAREALQYHIKRGKKAWTKEEKTFFYEKYMAKLEKPMPMGKKRGRPSRYSLADRLS